MSYSLQNLTPKQMEERRMEGADLLKAGWPQAEVARELEVSRATVHDWARRLKVGGRRALYRRSRSGRPAKLTRAQKVRLLRLLKRGARAAGFETERWTGRRIQRLIAQEFAIDYHPRYLPRLLQQLGWSQQLPLARASERDEAAIQTWLAQDWPRIKKGSSPRCHDCVF